MKQANKKKSIKSSQKTGKTKGLEGGIWIASTIILGIGAIAFLIIATVASLEVAKLSEEQFRCELLLDKQILENSNGWTCYRIGDNPTITCELGERG